MKNNLNNCFLFVFKADLRASPALTQAEAEADLVMQRLNVVFVLPLAASTYLHLTDL